MTTRIQSRALEDGAVTGPKVAAGPITDSKIAATSRFPAGAMAMFAGATDPTCWLLCQGQAVSRATNAALLAAIGTTWARGTDRRPSTCRISEGGYVNDPRARR